MGEAAGRKLVPREVIVNRAGFAALQGVAIGFFVVNLVTLTGINVRFKKFKDNFMGKIKKT